MSRHNKVNPAHYTQRGRLTPDDAAREVARQRSVGAPHRWHPLEMEVLLPRSKPRAQAADQPAAAGTPSGKKAAGKAKTVRIAKPAASTTATGNKRKAVLARNVGGPGLKPLREAKGRKR